MRGKPIRFGYKNYVLCSDDGYPFKVILYLGKFINKNQGPLEFTVIKVLPEVVNDDKWRDVYFDNFFSFLLEDLKQQSLPATETVLVNRLLGLPLPSPKVMEKKERGKVKSSSTLLSLDGWIIK